MLLKDLKQIVRTMIVFLIIPVVIAALAGCSSHSEEPVDSAKIPVRVLILPKFEVGELEGDFPGEAQYFYEEYLIGGDTYEVGGSSSTGTLYYKDGVALCLTGQGKVAAALTTSAVLADDRFDFTDAYILSVGCGGSAEGYGILGDVYVITAAVDYDLGHHADTREMRDKTETTWFHDESFDDVAVIHLDQSLTDHVFEQLKNIPLKTTEQSVQFLSREFPGEAWADRQPQVMRGTSVTSDNFWKGIYDHQNALLITETYNCRDPYAITEMEDIAVSQAAKRFDMLDRLIILRVSVNMDVFPAGITPEELWGPESDDHIASEDSVEAIDIFETAMQNCFDTGKVVMDELLQGQ